MPEALRVFISYSHKDEALRKELETHLAPLRRQGLIGVKRLGTLTGHPGESGPACQREERRARGPEAQEGRATRGSEKHGGAPGLGGHEK